MDITGPRLASSALLRQSPGSLSLEYARFPSRGMLLNTRSLCLRLGCGAVQEPESLAWGIEVALLGGRLLRRHVGRSRVEACSHCATASQELRASR